MKVYISGPISGHDDLNEPAFREAAEAVWECGYVPVVPHDLAGPHLSYQECMRRDLEELMRCSAILMLPGWRRSRGARIERRVASVIGLRVVESPGELVPGAGRVDEA